jgi:nitrile hydratase accessory protein
VSERRIEAEVSAMRGAAALPRRNGELVFEAPWQSRAFGMAVGLRGRGLFAWDDFRDRLIAAVGAPGHDAAAPDAAALYYSQWLAALEALLVERGVLTSEELERRRSEFASGKRDEVF